MGPQCWASVSHSVPERMEVAASGPPRVGSAHLSWPRDCGVIPPRKCHVGKPAPTLLAPCLPDTGPATWCCARDPARCQLSCPPGLRAPALWSPKYSRQNLRKSDCSSLRAFRNILPFSVPTTKALSSCTATQATSAFSLESAEHCAGSRDVSPGKGPPLWTPQRGVGPMQSCPP